MRASFSISTDCLEVDEGHSDFQRSDGSGGTSNIIDKQTQFDILDLIVYSNLKARPNTARNGGCPFGARPRPLTTGAFFISHLV
jgi:hypothetical protein